MSIFTYHPPETLVGVTGLAGSGKDTVADVFEDRGFAHYSLGDLVREEIQDRGNLEIKRENTTIVANELRVEYGDSYWVQRALGKNTLNNSEVVLSGIYSEGEARFMIDELGGQIIKVVFSDQESIEERYQRIVGRSDGDRDDISIEDFTIAHISETSGSQSFEQNIFNVMDLASFTVKNTAGLDYIEQQVTTIINQLRS